MRQNKNEERRITRTRLSSNNIRETQSVFAFFLATDEFRFELITKRSSGKSIATVK